MLPAIQLVAQIGFWVKMERGKEKERGREGKGVLEREVETGAT